MMFHGDAIGQALYHAFQLPHSERFEPGFEVGAIILLAPLHDKFEYSIFAPLLTPASLVPELSHIDKFYPLISAPSTSRFIITQEFINMTNELLDLPPKISFVCGSSNSGKSTFCKYF